MKNIVRFCLASCFLSLLSACSGGGGSGDGGSGGSSNFDGDAWEAQAAVTQDGCGERISPVQQIFTFSSGNVYTGIATIPVVSSADGWTFGFEETNGNCTRSYTALFSNISGGTADVELVSHSECGGSVCENRWNGTAAKIN